MAISASQIATTNTLEQFRTEFNILRDDVSGLEDGSVTFSTISATTLGSSTINVQEDGTIVFEGATDNAAETTLTVVDPTADRTITLPNETGTVHTSGGDTTHTNIIIGDGANIGSTSDTNAIGISSGGVVSVTATTASTSASNGALTVAGGTGIAADLSVGDDVRLISDSAVLSFGADSDTTLTHTDGTGLTLNSTNKLTFGDAATFIHQSSNGVMTIDGEATIDLNASTAVLVSNDLKLNSDAAVLGLGADNDVTLTHVADTGILLNGTSVIQFNDASQNIGAPSATVLDINATDEVEINATLIDVNGNLDVSGTIVGASTLSATTGTFSGILKTDDATDATSTTDGSLQTDGGLSVVKDAVFGDDIKLLSDSAVIHFGADSDITLTHTADTSLTTNGVMIATTFEPSGDTASGDNAAIGYTSALGLILTGQGSTNDVTINNDADTAVIQIPTGGTAVTFAGNVTVGGDLDVTGSFDMSDANITNVGSIALDSISGDADSNTSITFSGSDIITFATGGSTAATLNASQVLTLSGNMIIPDAGTIGSASDTNAIAISSGGVVAISATTANTGATDGALTVAGGVGIAADLSVGDDLRLVSDAAIVEFGVNSDVTLTHVHDTGLLLNAAMVVQFRDSAINIGSPADGDLDINADDEIELNSTLIDINGNVEISGTTAQVGVSTSTATDIFNAGLSVKNGATGAGFVQFFEDSDNGTNKVTLVGPAATADITLTLPIEAGTMATEGTATALAIALG